MLLKISVLVIGTAKVKAPSTYTSAQLSWLEKAVKKFFTGFLVRTYYLLTKFMQCLFLTYAARVGPLI